MTSDSGIFCKLEIFKIVKTFLGIEMMSKSMNSEISRQNDSKFYENLFAANSAQSPPE